MDSNLDSSLGIDRMDFAILVIDSQSDFTIKIVAWVGIKRTSMLYSPFCFTLKGYSK
ncbi:hypothetical protein P872_17015 [Rhodonellum psychrophilum GCM71 = DSM 17998]|uniref:Uncharacterized protein n=1 Tax=Rhodonellum psychrophilum GCM71 = DSM 17998 TaxID=1123057 RepID=U5C085_9BACT|nr:hypothetical protein P872_17015 [Rhodonellum psychrophilum GCM71 = DSM 17998]